MVVVRCTATITKRGRTLEEHSVPVKEKKGGRANTGEAEYIEAIKKFVLTPLLTVAVNLSLG